MKFTTIRLQMNLSRGGQRLNGYLLSSLIMLVVVHFHSHIIVLIFYCALFSLSRFIEGDFDTYVSQIRKPHVWGGEPELFIASHVLQ